jgi:hypothetical protein
MANSIDKINALTEKYGLSETVKQEFIKILNDKNRELLIDFSNYVEREWNGSDVPIEVIDEYILDNL